MKYACLIYSSEAANAELLPAGSPEFNEMIAGYMAFGEEAGAAGVLLDGDALTDTTTSTTVRVRDGEISTTDGPFAETKEQLGGFYLLECKDLDEAIAWAAKIPTAAHGCVEVRPVQVFD